MLCTRIFFSYYVLLQRKLAEKLRSFKCDLSQQIAILSIFFGSYRKSKPSVSMIFRALKIPRNILICDRKRRSEWKNEPREATNHVWPIPIYVYQKRELDKKRILFRIYKILSINSWLWLAYTGHGELSSS